MATTPDTSTASQGYDVTTSDGTVKHFATKAEAEAYLATLSVDMAGIITASGSTSDNQGFCAEEERISNHTCNSLHPAIALDCQGNRNIVWYDNRDGNFEIYYKALPSKLSASEISEQYSTSNDEKSRPTNLNCPVGFSGYRLLSAVCQGFSSSAEAAGGIRRVATSLTVNNASLAVYLTDNAADFLSMSINVGSSLTFENGLNMNMGTNVKAVISAKVLELTYNPTLKADADFVYFLDNTISKKDSCETRITCTKTPSLFPDVVSDCYCRSHLVWHDNETETDQIYYSQVGYGAFQQKCGSGEVNPNSVNIGSGGFSPLSSFRPGSYWFMFKGDTSITNFYAKSGDVGQRVSYGVAGNPPSSGAHLHTIFKDNQAYGGAWVGLSKYYDRAEWNGLINDPASFVPPIVIATQTPIAQVGDFGTTHDFQNLAFMGMTPPDLGIEMETLTLPLIPRCAPGGSSQARSQTVIDDDIVASPKRPLPPTYVDPVDITALMTSPYATLDSTLPNRYTIEGDESGTIYTNSFVSDARNQLSQLVFAKKESGDQYKFILSTRKCGDGPCAVRPSKSFDSNVSSQSQTMFSLVLQVWRGPDYRVDSGFIDNQENTAEKMFEKEFFLSPGSDMTTFAFSPGELTLNRGSMYYFVAIPSVGLDLMTRGVGGGNVLWSNDGTGNFTQYNIPFTVPPYGGVNAPIFLEGYLANSPRTDTELDEEAARDEIPPGARTDCANSINVDPGFGTQLMIPFTELGGSQGLGFSPATGNLIASANYPTGLPHNLESIDGNATRSPFATGFSGGQGETNVCTIETTAGGFTQGETFCGNGEVGQVVKVSIDGSVQYPWVTLPDDTALFSPTGWSRAEVPVQWRGTLNICHDETGIFGNALIVVSLSGYVFLVKSDGTASILALIPKPKAYYTWNYYHSSKLSRGKVEKLFADDEWLKGVVVVPNDLRRFGPWAGKIVVGAKRTSQVFTVTTAGVVQAFNICITVEDLKIIKANKDLYAVSVGDNSLYRIRSSELEHVVGDLVVSQQEFINTVTRTDAFGMGHNRRAVQWQPVLVRNTSGQIWHMHWSNKQQKFIAVKLAGMTSGIDNMVFANLGCAEPPCNQVQGDETSAPCTGEAKISNPIRLTSSAKDNQYPALAITSAQNLWLVWHSTRNGTEDIYAARYFGRCSIWNSSATGGTDLRVTRFSEDGLQRRAKFPRVAADRTGIAHVVFQLTDANGNSQIYYTKSKGDEFITPIKITDSQGDAIMPDIAIAYDSAQRMMITVVWHDNRFGNWEVMSTNSVAGAWRSSSFGGQDVRISASKVDSMFPRVRADKDGNLRVVFHSNRSGKYDVYMASYSALAQRWSSSANGASDLKVSNGPSNSMFPDLDTDSTGGLVITWQDDRHMSENPDMHEEIYATYCAKMGHPSRPHFSALVTNIEQKMDFRWQFVDCNSGKPIDATNTENVCLKIKASNATFWRAVNASGQYSDWASFKPSIDLDTTIVPWSLSCGNGTKEVCVQVQDQDVVAFPICQSIVLAKPPDSFKVELFSDEAMTQPLPDCAGRQAASEGKTYVKITTPIRTLTIPTFDVVQRGLASVYNQETEPIEMNDDGTFTVIDPKKVASTVENGTLTVVGYKTFRGMFTIKRQDELYHMDGLSRIIVHSSALCSSRPGETSTTTSPEVETDNIIVPPITVHTPGWSAAGGTATWTSQTTAIPLSCADLALTLAPSVNDIPFNLTLGGLAQPFTSGAFAGGSATFYIRAAKRTLPSWLSSFSSRTLKFSLIKDFLLPGQSTLGQVSIDSALLEEVDLDVISGSLVEPAVAGDIDPFAVTITGLPAIGAGTSLALEVKDESYASYVNEYGANAKMFVVAIGDPPLLGSPYYIEEF